jgi:hypothetical protein
MDISSRILRLLQSVAAEQVEQFSEIIENGASYLDDVLKEWEKKHGLDQSTYEQEESSWQSNRQSQQQSSYRKYQSQSEQAGSADSQTGFSNQVAEDLHLFGLTPPVSLDTVKKARNREIKKFHPDKFLNEPEKIETAKRILQIYNAAYDRLERALK